MSSGMLVNLISQTGNVCKRLLPITPTYTPAKMKTLSSDHWLAPSALSAAISRVFSSTIIVSVITMKIADFIVDSKIGPLDRTLGFVFGAARGALLVVVGLLFFNWLMPENQPGWVANAKSKPVLESIGEGLVQLLPDDPEKSIIERLKPKDGAGDEGEGEGETNG